MRLRRDRLAPAGYELRPMIVVLMGVSGSGKTAVGSALAGQLGWEFHDADDLHSQANRNKMRNGIALTDSDRMPWLQRVRALIDQCLERGTDAILACSLLKQSYRDLVIPDSDHVRLIYLKGSRTHRPAARAPPDTLCRLLSSPANSKLWRGLAGASTIDISGTTVQVAEQVRRISNLMAPRLRRPSFRTPDVHHHGMRECLKPPESAAPVAASTPADPSGGTAVQLKTGNGKRH